MSATQRHDALLTAPHRSLLSAAIADRCSWFCLMAYSRVCWLLLGLCQLTIGPVQAQETGSHINPEIVKWWAEHLRIELKNVADFFTRKDLAKQGFRQATLELRNDSKTTEEIAESITVMMNMKVEAVKRIVDIAEEKAQAAEEIITKETILKVDEENDKADKVDELLSYYQYYNSKCVDGPPPPDKECPCSNQTAAFQLKEDPHFWGVPVNTSYSSVHVPTNVFDRSRDVLQAIKWSEELDATFRKNYHDDPSLSWQYFGSSTGFMRHYPAMEWKPSPDLYDCRTRLWYIEAASSPKDMVILVDHSGSMTGVRKEIARHVVDDILDTLGNNDYVNIIRFNDNASYVVDCFEDRLVQANLGNIRAFKEELEHFETDNIANFSLALEMAFRLLDQYRDGDLRDDEHRGANCNQAIMLVTDGVPYKFVELFSEYNWPNISVRVFTYLVGREVPDVRDIRWMACANRGYYVHLSTQAEVREKVLQYVPVMARPLVLTKDQHPVIWTPVYSDSTDPKMTDWIWEQKEKAVQRKILVDSRQKNGKWNNLNFSATQIERQKVETPVSEEAKQHYRLLTSIAIPVFDKRDYAILWVNENVETLKKSPVKTRIANLLGVAGADVRISDIKKLMNPFKLGVGGYASIVTNNGFVLYHPDLRAEFNGILKPNYNSVDFVEVEVDDEDDRREPREYSKDIQELRRRVINRETGKSRDMRMKQHMDWLMRGGSSVRRFFYTPIANSPFSLVVAMPVTYGPYRVNSSIEIKLLTLEGKEKVTDWLTGRRWRLHPDWVYCKYANESYQPQSKEEEVCQLLARSQQPGWRWPNTTVPQSATNRSSGIAKDAYYCDRELFLALVYDAKYTRWFNEDLAKTNITFKDLKDRFGITSSFIATRSGLTRWKDFSGHDRKNQPAFGDIYPRAIDETWYRRAVDHFYSHRDNRDGYVYSVPFDFEERNETLVTVSHAVFAEQGDARAPMAVVGYQFQHKALRDLFFNKTKECPDKKSCKTCTSTDLDCYILDDNGYVVVSENTKDTGRFFGMVDNNVMPYLVEGNRPLYRRTRYFDYQGVCFKLKGNPVIVSSSCKPVTLAKTVVQWLLGTLLWLSATLGVSNAQNPLSDYIADDFPEDILAMNSTSQMLPESPSPEARNEINKTRPASCDQEYSFYNLQYDELNRFSRESRGDCDKSPFFVHRLLNTNLIFVVVNRLCPSCRENCEVSIEPKEVDLYQTDLICHKFEANNLFRRRPQECISRHYKEKEIDMCGRGSHATLNRLLVFLILLASYWGYRFE